jgi:hypothetical protein
VVTVEFGGGVPHESGVCIYRGSTGGFAGFGGVPPGGFPPPPGLPPPPPGLPPPLPGLPPPLLGLPPPPLGVLGRFMALLSFFCMEAAVLLGVTTMVVAAIVLSLQRGFVHT